ncbi:MAG: hypothetical protein V4735_08860 [Pseudomonadota bacterium]
MSTQVLKIFSVILASAIFIHSPAFAEKGGNDHGKGKGSDKFDHGNKEYNKGNKDEGGKHRIVVTNSDRDTIRHYIAEDYRSSCPPGLAKKNNGCLPPGQAKKRYSVGQPLLVEWRPVPQPLVVQLRPVPVGYQYVMVDKDVLLISEASKHVIDAITLMSAVGQ